MQRVQSVSPSESMLNVLIIGSGFAGLCMGIKLLEAGETSFVILERASRVGGTWRDNNYPGCACDVKSRLYSFSFEQNPEWSRLFAGHAEILAYLEHCVKKYGLDPYLRFEHEVVEARFDEAQSCWAVKTRGGQQYRARVLVSGTGGLSRPAIPDLPGLKAFQGKVFHSAQWDHGYDLRGKRVAVIGTGASAIQFVPEIAPVVEHLDLYQRNAPYILPRDDRPIHPFERALFRRFPWVQMFLRGLLYWGMEGRVLGFIIAPRVMKLMEKETLKYLESQVSDPELVKRLTPRYTFGCKRVLISDNYYPALVRPNVSVLTEGIREIRAHSIVDGVGQERPVDTLILGTGFQAQSPLPRGMIFGRQGRDLMDAWSEGAEAFKGTTVSGFPNLFMLVGPNTGVGHTSMVYMIESQVQYVMSALKVLRERGIVRLEVKREVMARYNRWVQEKSKLTVWASGCMSWYVNEQGRNTTLWPDFTYRFRAQTKKLDLADYEVVTVEE